MKTETQEKQGHTLKWVFGFMRPLVGVWTILYASIWAAEWFVLNQTKPEIFAPWHALAGMGFLAMCILQIPFFGSTGRLIFRIAITTLFVSEVVMLRFSGTPVPLTPILLCVKVGLVMTVAMIARYRCYQYELRQIEQRNK